MQSEEILKHCKMIQTAVDIEVPLGDIDTIEGKMLQLVALMGLSSELMKEAKNNVLVKQGLIIDIIRREEKGIAPTTMKLILESRMATELTIYEYCDRLNRAIVHACDSLRTSISKYKIERELSTYGK